MSSPITSQKAFSYFGYMIGTMPPAAIVVKAIANGDGADMSQVLFLVLLLIAGITTGFVGYLTGKYVPGAIIRVKDFALPNRVALYSLIGLAWGAVSGTAGGLFLFIIGAIFAGVVGGIVGAFTVPVVIMLHEALRRGDLIEMKHFLPVAFAITLSLCAFILGF